MGYLTTITIHNDALHSFKEDPKGFGEAILRGIEKADMEHGEVTIGFGSYCNYISVQKPRHADDHCVYLHYGNTVAAISKYESRFEEFAKRSPEIAMKFVKRAKELVLEAEKFVKSILNKKDL